MFIQRIKTPGLAHNAYLLGDKEQSILVDPSRNIDEYLKIARENDLPIKYVAETLVAGAAYAALRGSRS